MCPKRHISEDNYCVITTLFALPKIALAVRRRAHRRTSAAFWAWGTGPATGTRSDARRLRPGA